MLTQPELPTCLVADDHPAIVDLVSNLLPEWGFSVAGSARDGTDALAKIRELRPGVALLDVRLPKLSGIDVVRAAGTVAPGTVCVLYSGYGEPGLVTEALDAGARGFVLKDAPLDDLQRALEMVTRGEIYVDPVAAGDVLAAEAIGEFTARERAVLRLLGQGKATDEIGKLLCVSSETVSGDVSQLLRKLGAGTRAEAIAKAFRAGIIA